MTNDYKSSDVQVAVAPVSHADDRIRVLSAALAAALFGSFLLLGMGFAHSATIHNATHDARHAFALPCH